MRLPSSFVAIAFVAISVATPTNAIAQPAQPPTAADGVLALVRGEEAAAASILRPLAEESAEPDPLALFFLAAMYETGRGVPQDGRVPAASFCARASSRARLPHRRSS